MSIGTARCLICGGPHDTLDHKAKVPPPEACHRPVYGGLQDGKKLWTRRKR